MLNKSDIESFFTGLQDSICMGLEEADGKAKFQEDLWQREQGGGGRTRIIQNGNLLEKGGVNFSAVFGPCPEFLKKEMGLAPDKSVDFFASGVSIVLHPVNPFVPIIHMNVRYFEAGNVSWFGGGIDLTPHYVDEEDVAFFHNHLKKVCDKHHSSYYPEFKKWADEYFYIPHRQETRGIGGIFFDRLSATSEISIEQRCAFVEDVGENFLKVYLPLAEKYRNKKYTEANRQWQLLRRGRYVEFNLVYDRGTKFGLMTNGRAESILMSLPATAQWEYNHVPAAGSAEEKTLKYLGKTYLQNKKAN
jgi:coproporphyrinogen III oxidase